MIKSLPSRVESRKVHLQTLFSKPIHIAGKFAHCKQGQYEEREFQKQLSSEDHFLLPIPYFTSFFDISRHTYLACSPVSRGRRAKDRA